PAGIQGIMIAQVPQTAGQQIDFSRQSEAFFNLAALAIERAYLGEKANQAKVLESSEKLQTALLRSISHDLRTPLAAISGVLDSLNESETANTAITLDQQARLELIQTGLEEVTRLNQLVGNILDMTRLEGGAMRLKVEEIDLQDLIGTSLQRMSSRLNGHPVTVQLEPGLPYLRLDFVLMEQVLVNLLDNAAKYSPAGALIEVEVKCQPRGVLIAIHDRGIGIPPESLDMIFDKFFRIKSIDGVTGSGLGLTICKGIVEAHNGQIWAENRPEGGSSFLVLLPYGQPDQTDISKE
ncbi:MAG: ATP-binding protein, partial [Anaerolineaceae bacterium]